MRREEQQRGLLELFKAAYRGGRIRACVVARVRGTGLETARQAVEAWGFTSGSVVTYPGHFVFRQDDRPYPEHSFECELLPGRRAYAIIECDARTANVMGARRQDVESVVVGGCPGGEPVAEPGAELLLPPDEESMETSGRNERTEA